MEVITEIHCRHPGCSCPPEPPFAPFCSAYCRNVVQDAARESSQTDPEGACACGHEDCPTRASEELAPSVP
jgi:hypothetical protein